MYSPEEWLARFEGKPAPKPATVESAPPSPVSTEHGLKDSGTRETYGTGAMKENWSANLQKGRFDLIPPEPLRQLAEHYAKGAVKYGAYNWLNGLPLSRLLDSAMRHLNQLIAGCVDENHAIAVAWNIFGYIQTRALIDCGKLPASLDDLPSYGSGSDYRPTGPGFYLKDECKGLSDKQLDTLPDEAKYVASRKI